VLSTGKNLPAPPIVPVNRNKTLPLSFAQQRLWFLDQLEPDVAVYNVPVAVRMTGTLNIAALEQTFSEVVRRHEALRTTFAALDRYSNAGDQRGAGIASAGGGFISARRDGARQ